jgi:hypothetical protein
MIITFPLMFVFVARMALSTWERRTGRRLLATLTIAQAGLTILFLSYIHQLDRPVRGDYGMPYRVQMTSPHLTAAKN